MSLNFIHPTVNFFRHSGLIEFAFRLLVPILIIYLLPTEESFLQHFFQGEGLCRILRCAWSFRASIILSLKKAGFCSIIFALEEALQEICLYFLI